VPRATVCRGPKLLAGLKFEAGTRTVINAGTNSFRIKDSEKAQYLFEKSNPSFIKGKRRNKKKKKKQPLYSSPSLTFSFSS
jgi:hypothetical protein